tara:strand:+ start:523 stop:699 length:177 start_codon:yes stop_codon:yes gene_type:complete
MEGTMKQNIDKLRTIQTEIITLLPFLTGLYKRNMETAKQVLHEVIVDLERNARTMEDN